MSVPSEKAVIAAWNASAIEHTGQADIDAAVRAAHDPALGLDRSVCLRDVVEALRECAKRANYLSGDIRNGFPPAADFIEHEFGK